MEVTNTQLLLYIARLYVEKELVIDQRDALTGRLADLEEPEPKLEVVE